MDVISFEYTKQRKEFGRHPTFSDSKVDVTSVSFKDKKNEGSAVNPSKRSMQTQATGAIATQTREEVEKQWIPKKSNTVDLDCVPEMSEHWVNTERFVQCHKGMQHTQGGWPKDVKTSDVQDRERFLRRIENLPQYTAAIKDLCKTVEGVIQQNHTVDIYENYFDKDEEEEESTTEPPSAKTVCVFRDRKAGDFKRAATKISWHPDGTSKLAVAYSIMQFQQMPENMPVSSFIWDVNSPNEPDFELVPPSPLSSLVYNPRSQDYIVGGCYNGLVSFWDLRKGKEPVESSLIEHSHRDPVYDIFWIQSRTGNECVSSSTDGQLLWWDVRKLAAGPTDSMSLRVGGESQPPSAASLLPSAQGGANNVIYGATCLEYRTDAGATRYLMGSEQGVPVLADRKAKKEASAAPTNDNTKSIKTVFGSESGRHHGPIYSIQRHPYAPKYFLSVGDWSARVWIEDIKTPLLSTKFDRSYLTGGCWSPSRPGVFFTTKMDGTLDIWDYFYKQNDPVFSTKVGDQPLTAIKVHAQGRLVALGAQDGSATILQISNGLSEQQPNEKQSITQMFERETKREKNLELRLNQKKREANQGQRKNVDTSASSTKSDEKLDALLKQVESDFFRLIEDKDSRAAPQPSSDDAESGEKMESAQDAIAKKEALVEAAKAEQAAAQAV